jgi:hypothetical protein|tara:strand:- start:8656 stop:9084 length:429 start_codon:yes stop_codon:yes gene_type:complete
MADLFKEILPDINHGHTNLIRTGEMNEAEYGRSCFIINRALSMNIDTILYVNEMNANWQLDPLLQYDYYINSLRKKKRWSKWAKATVPSSDLELIKEYYNYNEQKAREVLDLLSGSEIQKLRLKLSKGGTDDNGISKKTKCR